MKRIIISIFAAAALIGCAKELTPGQAADQVTVQPGQLVEFSTVFADAEPQARVVVDLQTGKLSWSEGDQVAVVLTDGTNYSYDETTYTVDHETGILAIPENTAYVIYPASQKGTLSGTKLTLKLPDTHSVATPEAAFDNAIMKGVVNGTKIEFKNLFGFFKVPVTGEGKLKSAVLRTICRTTTDFHPVSGSATLDLSKEVASDGAIKMGTNNEAFAWVRYNFTGDVNLADNPSVYFAVPAGQYDNLGIVLVSDNGSNAIYANNSHSVDRSTVKPVSASAINLTSRTPKSPISLVGTTGNAQEDYANCYMVPPTAGSYEFECKLADGTDLKGKGGVTAEIKWAEQAGMINNLYYNPETNKISFTTNGTEGNALVVLNNNTDDGKNCLWTWHIWITDSPKVLQVKGGGSSSGNTYYLMDRVLGATWAPSSTLTADASKTYDGAEVPMCKTVLSSDATDACGVYFQYHNRIPFPRIKNIDAIGSETRETMTNTKCDVMYGFSQYGQYWSSSSSAATVWQDKNTGQYIFNNFHFHNYEYIVEGSGYSLWSQSSILNAYGVTSSSVVVDGGYRFWSSNTSRTHSTMMSSKTTHDPCPPGYVIETTSCQYHYVDQRKKDVSFARAAADNSSYKEGYKFYGMYFNVAKDEEGNDLALYFPCASARTGCVVNLSGGYGNMGYLYSVNTNKDNAPKTFSLTSGDKTFTAGYGTCVQFGASTGGNTIGWPSWSTTKKVHAQAYNVRCRRGKF